MSHGRFKAALQISIARDAESVDCMFKISRTEHVPASALPAVPTVPCHFCQFLGLPWLT